MQEAQHDEHANGRHVLKSQIEKRARNLARHARHKQTRAKWNNLLHGKGFTLPEQPDNGEGIETPETAKHTLPKRVRMRLKARLDRRKARLSDLISARKNDNDKSNTEENDNEKK